MERRDYQQILESELSVVRAQNERLTDENSFLREKLNRLTSSQRSTAASNVEANVRLLQLEDERNDMWENLEKLKKRYNKLHEAYCDKVKRCRILENTFQQQKTLPGLVTKTALKQRNEARGKTEPLVTIESEVSRLQAALEESYDVIDSLEFELDSVELLEEENQILRKELADLKKEFKEQSSKRYAPVENSEPVPSVGSAAPVRNVECGHQSRESTCESCVNVLDFDNETLERNVLTHSVLNDVKAEARLNKRELLKCRIQNATKANLNEEAACKEKTTN